MAFYIGVGDNLSQQSRFSVTLNDGNPAVILKRHGDQVAGFVDCELAREPSSTRHLLEQFQAPRLRVDGVVDERIRRDLSTIGGV